MSNQKKHVVILPYFCQEEVDRYVKIAARIKTFPKPNVDCEFLLASSPRTETSQQLVDTYSELGPTTAFACPTQIFGYPEGPGAMFWDSMEFISKNYAGNDGFSLWLESDMAPIKPDWLDRLSEEWYSGNQTPIMMGCFVPEVYKYRYFKQPKLLLAPHINGGACYSMDFADAMPAEARTGVFDMAVYQYAQKLGRARFTKQIAFSAHSRVRRDIADQDKVLLHGFMQQKDRFIEQCVTRFRKAKSVAQSGTHFLAESKMRDESYACSLFARAIALCWRTCFWQRRNTKPKTPTRFTSPAVPLELDASGCNRQLICQIRDRP